jgi:hypothetical protein
MKSVLRWMSAALVATGISAAWSSHAFAGVKIGVTISATGPAALREALRAALENTKDMPASHGVFNMSANDHAGLDQRARVMVEIVGGKWKLSGD